ncbi:MAG: HNH endonuclease signature motif containing protein [Ignavibacteriales bacterium]
MAFTDEEIEKVWSKAERAGAENEKNGFRKDQCGAWIKRSEYGNRKSKYGWEIDHITPKANGGTDALSNLRPLHWENNCAKSDGRLVCVVKSHGDQNIAA